MPTSVSMDMPCCTGDAPCASPAQIVAMVEGTFFWPQFSRNFLTAGFTNGLGTQTFNSNSQLGSTDGSLLVAPRITLGVQGERWGLVGRYWYASSWASGFTPSNPSL